MACRTSIANDETSWDFSVFDLDRASNHHPIAYLVHHYVGQFKLHDALPISMTNLERQTAQRRAMARHGRAGGRGVSECSAVDAAYGTHAAR